MLLKPVAEYVDLSVDFHPLPQYGNLSAPTPEFEAAKPALEQAYGPLWRQPDFPSFREAAGNADAVIPPGGPDRYRDIVTNFLEFPARDGEMIELKVYKSVNVTEDATLMYRMHGGGWSVGSHEVDGAENVHAAANPNIVVVSIDYRLAPEHPFPQPFHDSYDGLLWCIEHADVLGVNPEKIILSGSSAGANLAAAVAIEARNNNVNITAQVLNFPSTSHPKFFPKEKYEFGSYIQNKDNPVLSLLMMETALDAHVPCPKPDWRHSPLLAHTLESLPPAFITNAGVDVLRDDAFAYAEALRAAGGEVELHTFAGLPHCFPGSLLDISETQEFYKAYNAFLQKHT